MSLAAREQILQFSAATKSAYGSYVTRAICCGPAIADMRSASSLKNLSFSLSIL